MVGPKKSVELLFEDPRLQLPCYWSKTPPLPEDPPQAVFPFPKFLIRPSNFRIRARGRLAATRLFDILAI